MGQTTHLNSLVKKRRWHISKFVNLVNSINIKTGELVKYLYIPLVAVMVFEVIARYVFNAPTRWAFETSQFINLALFVLVGGYALYYGAHVRVDVISRKFGRRAGPIVELVLNVCILLFFAVIMLWQGIDGAAWSWLSREHSASSWAPPVYPIKTLIPLGAFLLMLQALVSIINSVKQVAKRGEGESHN